VAALKEKCLHPLSNTPYIKSLRGGQDISPEGLQVSQHATIVFTNFD
jgi:hypothetical protein